MKLTLKPGIPFTLIGNRRVREGDTFEGSLALHSSYAVEAPPSVIDVPAPAPVVLPPPAEPKPTPAEPVGTPVGTPEAPPGPEALAAVFGTAELPVEPAPAESTGEVEPAADDGDDAEEEETDAAEEAAPAPAESAESRAARRTREKEGRKAAKKAAAAAKKAEGHA